MNEQPSDLSKKEHVLYGVLAFVLFCLTILCLPKRRIDQTPEPARPPYHHATLDLESQPETFRVTTPQGGYEQERIRQQAAYDADARAYEMLFKEHAAAEKELRKTYPTWEETPKMKEAREKQWELQIEAKRQIQEELNEEDLTETPEQKRARIQARDEAWRISAGSLAK